MSGIIQQVSPRFERSFSDLMQRLHIKFNCQSRIQPLRKCTEVLTEADIEDIQQAEHAEKKLRMQGRPNQDWAACSTITQIVTLFREQLSNTWGLEAPIRKVATIVSDSNMVAAKLQGLFELMLEEMSNALNSVSDFDPNFEQPAKNNSFTRSLENKYSTRDYQTASKGLEMVENTVVTASVVDCRDGTYMVTYEPRIAGEYNWIIIHNGLDVSPGDEVVHVAPGIINEKSSVIYGFGVHQAIAGQLAHFILQVQSVLSDIEKVEYLNKRERRVFNGDSGSRPSWKCSHDRKR